MPKKKAVNAPEAPSKEEQLIQSYRKIQEKVEAGCDRLEEIFAGGASVQDPMTNQKITFKGPEEATKYLEDLQQSGEYPLRESGRSGSGRFHMYIFLYSKGYKPADIRDFLLDPDSEKSHAMADNIRTFRDEYYDMIARKDTKAIADMYVNAFKTLQEEDISWLGKADSMEGLIQMYPMMEAVFGIQTSWLQTNKIGDIMRPVDREVYEKTFAGAKEQGVDVNAVVDSMSLIMSEMQSIKSAVRNSDQYDSKRKIAIYAQRNSVIPEGTTFGTLREVMGCDSIHRLTTTDLNVILNLDMEVAEDFTENTEAWFRGDADAVPPWYLGSIHADHVFDAVNAMRTAGCKDEDERILIRDDPAQWKSVMENGFREGKLMDAISVVHCICLAKAGKYDEIGSKKEGAKLLEVINGNHALYGELSEISKAAAAGHLLMKHPALYAAGVDTVLREMDKLGLAPDDPLYHTALDRAAKSLFYPEPDTYNRIKDKLAEKWFANNLAKAEKAEKTQIAKTLLMMQLGSAENEDWLMQDGGNRTMLARLASGATVDIRIPEGETPMSDWDVTFGNGIITAGYKKDSLQVKMSGVMAGERAQKTTYTAELRDFVPDGIRTLMEKIDSMDEAGLDVLIRQIKGTAMKKEELQTVTSPLGAEIVFPTETLTKEEAERLKQSYSEPKEGKRKYDAALEKVTVEKAAELTQKVKDPTVRGFFENVIPYYERLHREVMLYGEAAEQLHRIRKDNEAEKVPSAAIREFSMKKEREMAEKYRDALKEYRFVEDIVKEFANDRDEKTWQLTWVNAFEQDPGLKDRMKEALAREEISAQGLKEDIFSDAVLKEPDPMQHNKDEIDEAEDIKQDAEEKQEEEREEQNEEKQEEKREEQNEEKQEEEKRGEQNEEKEEQNEEELEEQQEDLQEEYDEEQERAKNEWQKKYRKANEYAEDLLYYQHHVGRALETFRLSGIEETKDPEEYLELIQGMEHVMELSMENKPYEILTALERLTKQAGRCDDDLREIDTDDEEYEAWKVDERKKYVRTVSNWLHRNVYQEARPLLDMAHYMNTGYDKPLEELISVPAEKLSELQTEQEKSEISEKAEQYAEKVEALVCKARVKLKQLDKATKYFGEDSVQYTNMKNALRDVAILGRESTPMEVMETVDRLDRMAEAYRDKISMKGGGFFSVGSTRYRIAGEIMDAVTESGLADAKELPAELHVNKELRQQAEQQMRAQLKETGFEIVDGAEKKVEEEKKAPAEEKEMQQAEPEQAVRRRLKTWEVKEMIEPEGKKDNDTRKRASSVKLDTEKTEAHRKGTINKTVPGKHA